LTNIEENTSKISSVIPNEIKFVTISAGKLTMGSPIGEAGRNPDEEQKHEVNITKPFELGIFPVTQRQWKAVMGYNPSHFRGEDRPVESVTWYDVQAFIRKLNKIEGADRYRLPTEAEWEYACRAGTITRYSFGDDDSELGEYGWYDKNSGSETHIVGRMKHNNWSLYDMHGNVSEWCQDVYTPDYNLPPPNVGELENESSQYRVRRGGAWGRDASSCRSAARDKDLPDFSRDALGFRLVREI
jgi:formylglycine-generating enzyme required for sulfatase activity